MAIREIRLLGDPVLRRPADDVEAFDRDLGKLVRDMFETMYAAEGVGLAAPQIGISRRVLVVDVRDEEDPAGGRIALVNPRVVDEAAERDRVPEGCLSIPGVEEVVERPVRVRIEGRDPEGQPVSLDAADLFGRALQHEIDHLDGILFFDRVSPLKRKMLLERYRKAREEAETT